MTTNQTIDGVPRKALADFIEYSVPGPYDHREKWEADKAELRALLDAPAEPKPTGLSQGWNLTRKHDGFVVGHQSAAYPPDGKAIERAERDGRVWVPFLLPAAQPPGEPVGYVIPGDMPAQSGYTKTVNPVPEGKYTFPLYAEQPAPVAVRMCDCNQGRMPCNGKCTPTS